ncbi:MAG: threonylcarbamoyl-AMP synthase [Nitrososphaerota archaeon]|nr:L-threonylcarbamoyladenylate synthase [Nitrososphaerota archaeon]MCL5671960.1 L-threonylcarbamoyladenylate synthase [Nitrososphaerota archaeon]MDG6937002.1 threonylcarbamoyl-AMP synthase [Nitrososphaerota archaeon]MDG6952149.1 threonylcarbamoyl-AMP synthase [Nitrososphaerota archaeon]MDG6961196.1 threonylcarbamoyl-AMP synthase [Nitrososphaerota archaeon]
MGQVLAMDGRAISRAAETVMRGGLVVYPTDTVYGLGCDPFNEEAVRRLFSAKGRGAKAVPVLCSSREKAADLVDLGPRGGELARRYWPGALTIVAPLKMRVPDMLSQGPHLGVRVPDHALCLELVASCGGWLAGTSANVSGAPSARSAGDALRQLGGTVDLILDGGPSPGAGSTVVSVVGGTLTILRTGQIGVEMS